MAKRARSRTSPIKIATERFAAVTGTVTGRIASVGILIVLLAAAAGVGYRRASAYAAEQDEFTVDAATFEVRPRPDWMTDKIAQSIHAAASTEGSFNLYAKSLVDLKNAIESSPWVRRVASLRKRYPNRLSVGLEFRRPVAFIRTADASYYLVDEDCVRVAGAFPNPSWEGFEGLPHVTDMSRNARTVPDEGAPFEARDILAGHAVAVLLEQEGILEKIPVTSIDVSRASRSEGVVLWTRHRTRIYWGRKPGEEEKGEIGVEEKLQRLRLYIDQFGDLGHIAQADLRFPDTNLTPR